METSIAGFPAGTRFTHPVGSEEWESEVIEFARRMGRSLRETEADTGQQLWSWSRADGTGPLFLTRRVAMDWMAELLERGDTSAA
jgi:hypothetical protein